MAMGHEICQALVVDVPPAGPFRSYSYRAWTCYRDVSMERKIFWACFTVLGLAADLFLPFWWAMGATLPIILFSWWVAYRSGWF